MRDRFLATVRRYAMFASGDTVAAGVSGGADSMCMLDLLRNCAEELGITLLAVHVNHGIRGAAADADEAFVREYCSAHGVAFVSRSVDVPALAEQTGESTELCARNARYDIFASLGTDKVATAHTGSDSVETLLMNLSRGAGLHGLCGIPPVRGNIVRPLIDFTRAETEAYCAQYGVPYVTDGSNLSDDYTRNRFRHTVVPALTAINPAFEANALRCIGLLRQDDACLEETARRLLEERFDPEEMLLRVSGLSDEPDSVKTRVVARYLERATGADAEYVHIALLARHLNGPYALTLPSGAAVVCDGSVLRRAEQTAPPEEPAPVSVEKDAAEPIVFAGKRITFSVADALTEVTNGVVIDYDKADRMLTVRARRPGDAIRLPKRGCTKSLKKYFNEIALPPEERARVPVICDGNGVVALAGLTADAARCPDQNTKKILIILTEDDKNGE